MTQPALHTLAGIVNETRPRPLGSLDQRQDRLPEDASIYAEDVIQFGIEQWMPELKRQGHVLELEHAWKDTVSHYPMYTLRTSGGEKLALRFHGVYPHTLFLTVGFRRARMEQMSDAKGENLVRLPLTMDPERMFEAIRSAAEERVN